MKDCKQCSKCAEIKLIELFPKKGKKGRICNECVGKHKKEKFEQFKDEVQIKIKIKICKNCSFSGTVDKFAYQRLLCIECFNKYMIKHSKKYRLNNNGKVSNYNKKYRIENKDFVRSVQNNYHLNRKKTDPSFKLRYNVSGCIRNMIIRNGGSKGGKSTTKYLDFTFEQLKNHLDSLLESWMNWDNYGMYNPKTWDDNDSSTWTWNIDHIIPQSDLPYNSMDHPNFKKAWSLSNLRPLSAKQNCIEGASRIRHKK